MTKYEKDCKYSTNVTKRKKIILEDYLPWLNCQVKGKDGNYIILFYLKKKNPFNKNVIKKTQILPGILI